MSSIGPEVIFMAKWVKKTVRVARSTVMMKKRDPKTGKLRKMRTTRRGHMMTVWAKE